MRENYDRILRIAISLGNDSVVEHMLSQRATLALIGADAAMEDIESSESLHTPLQVASEYGDVKWTLSRTVQTHAPLESIYFGSTLQPHQCKDSLWGK